MAEDGTLRGCKQCAVVEPENGPLYQAVCDQIEGGSAATKQSDQRALCQAVSN